MPKSTGTADTPAAPPPVTEPSLTPEQRDARARLGEVQKEIGRLSMLLVSAPPEEVAKVNLDLARNRIAMLSMNEIVTGVADPALYREMALLNKMLAGRDLEDDEDVKEKAAADEDVLARLGKVGLDPSRAGQMVRALQALERIFAKKPAYGLPADDSDDIADDPVPR